VYPEEMVKPMRDELTSLGMQELRTAKEVEELFNNMRGTSLLVINSVCGCAAGNARPGVRLALKHKVRPQTLATVFAGQDIEAVEKARSYMNGYPPSSPSMALFKDGEVVFMLERAQIEGRPPEVIADALKSAFNEFCM
jgi:putative YphP/YqiW family bacilliredoxin